MFTKKQIILTAIVFIVFVPISALADEPFGTNLGEFNSVAAYSNCSNDCISCNNYCGSNNYVNGIYTGIKWQCVEYVRRYYLEVYNIDLASKYLGNANTWYDNASTMGLDGYLNGGSTAPQVGDILVSNGGGYGHVAIVRSVTNDQVCTVQQNFSNDLNDLNRCLALTVSNGNYTIDGFDTNYPIQGWLRYHLNDGLVAYYPFNGNANDKSGNGNNGTVLGAILTTDRFGNDNSAYSFDGVNDYIEIPDTSKLSGGSPLVMSISVWFKVNNLLSNVTPIIGKTLNNSSKDWSLIVRNSKLTFYSENGESIFNDYYCSQTTGEILTNVWYHGAFIAQEPYIYIYVNGNLVGSCSNLNGESINTTAPVQIGAFTYLPAYYSGITDDIRVYSRALSESDIQELYFGSPDSDGDGYPACNDNDLAVNPGAVEGPYGNATCSDTLDNDCDGAIDAADTNCQSSNVDLIVSSWTAPANACAGATISIKDTTKNQGTGTAGASTTRFYFSTNTTLDAGDTPLGSRAVPSLNPATISTGTTSVTLPNVAIGKYYLIAMADDGKVVPETNETNNKKSKVIYIGPDLIVSTLTAPTSAVRGTTISIGDTTKNKGCGTAGASTTKFYLSTNTTINIGVDYELGTRPIPALGTNAISTGTTSVVIPAGISTGKYYIIANSDDAKVVVEGNETNNKKTKAITINP